MVTIENLNDFFSRYALTVNNALFGGVIDTDVFHNSFASFVVGANPLGIAGGSNDDKFQKAITDGIDFYKRIGIISMNISSIEITTLDHIHSLVKVFWKAFYVKDDLSGEIPFEVFYVVQNGSTAPKIFAYITGDEQAALRQHHLIQ
jgi:hypothetical protein